MPLCRLFSVEIESGGADVRMGVVEAFNDPGDCRGLVRGAGW